eukprot:scaffold25127_cov132-Cylindrotheca_fusiformis.AAC.2
MGEDDESKSCPSMKKDYVLNGVVFNFREEVLGCRLHMRYDVARIPLSSYRFIIFGKNWRRRCQRQSMP